MEIKAGLVGCGFIGRSIIRFLKTNPLPITISALCDPDDEAVNQAGQLLNGFPCKLELSELIDECQLIIEAASMEAAAGILENATPKGKDILIISVGGAITCGIDWQKMAARSGSRVFIPSGAVGGLDALKGTLCDGVHSVKITTRKPPRGLIGAPKVVKDGIDLDALTEPLEVFTGTAREAIALFPKNINVAATVSLAGIGPDLTMVSIFADPTVENNIHQVEIEGESGRVITINENKPSPDNPRTSYLAALSTIATLKGIYSSVRIGT